ncbi:MAG: helix-turn-helix domain-containing protein [Bacillota bacterium]
MQNESFKGPKDENKNFSIILQKARDGDNQAMEELIDFFKDEINSLCKYIKVSKEDVVQELYKELILLVRGDNNGEDN